MAEEQADAKPQAAEGKKEEKPLSPYKSVAQEASEFLGTAKDFGLASLLLGGTAAVGGLESAILGSSYVLSGHARAKKAKPEDKIVFSPVKESLKGALGGIPTAFAVKKIQDIYQTSSFDSLSSIVGSSSLASAVGTMGLAWGATALISLAYSPISYFIEKRSFKGYGEYFKKNFLKDTFKYTSVVGTSAGVSILGAPYISSFLTTYLPAFLTPYAALAAPYLPFIGIALANMRYRGWPDILKPSYLLEGLGSAAYKGVKGVSEAVYAAGSGVGNFISSLFKQSPAPAPAK